MSTSIEAAGLEAEALVPRAVRTRVLARWLGCALCGLLVIVLIAPWQQSVVATGRVTAYAPVERRQTLEAPITGRVRRWLVREGSHVEAGQALVEISDNDAQLTERLAAERRALADKQLSYSERLAMLEAQIATAVLLRKSELSAADAKLRATTEKLRSLERKVEGAEATLDTAALNLARVRALHERGLAAARDLELADLAATRARTDRDSALADVLAARGDVDAAQAALEKARADGDAKIQESEVKLRSGRSELADAQASLARIDVTIARQSNQLVRAPRAGVILQVLAAEGGDQVKQGDVLATLVPRTEDRAVELWIDGNDAAIVSEGRKVRLQFEGWPAVQFAGWPSVAVGTFGGVVSFIDPHDDGQGNFRIVVVPDPREEPWPSARFLRQGVRASAWVLLERVKLGFELWRRFNGFPPMLERAPGASGATANGKEESKP